MDKDKNEKEKKKDSKMLSSALVRFLNQTNIRLSGEAAIRSVDHLNLALVQETYSGAFENNLKKILKDEPITFENLHIALKNNKLAFKQVERIISKIYSYKEKVDSIYKIFKAWKNNKKVLEDYCSQKLISPNITRDKTYLQLKKSIESTGKFLCEEYNIINKNDMQKKLNHSKQRMLLISKLQNKLKNLKEERSYIRLSLKNLVKKVRGSIASLHPELKQFLDFLSFEQMSNLKILKEQFNFSPKSIDDFNNEIKQCKIKMKKNPANKGYYDTMLKLLDAVSSEYYKNYEHSKSLEKGYTKEQTTDRIIPYGDMDM